LQWEINRVKEVIGEPDLPFTATPAILEVIKSLQWEMTSNDSVQTGLNNFLLADEILHESIGSQSLYELLHSDGAAPTLADATKFLKAKPGAPKMIYQSRQQTRRFETLLKVVMGVQHPVAVELNLYNNKVLSTEAKLHLLQGEHLLLPTMLCKKVTVATSNWFKAQAATPAALPSPNFKKVFDDIDA
jgi:hypothetical protein